MPYPAKNIAFTIILSLFTFTLTAQNSLDVKAEKHYRANEYSEALPLYQSLVKKYRTNAKYNHRLGVCYFETKGSLTEADKHLKYAKSKGIRYANFYLAQVYKQQYKFDEAISTFNTYLRGIRSDNENYDFVKQEINHCEELKTYLLRTEEIEILTTQTVSINNFFSHYSLSKESGKIITSKELWNTSDTSFVMYMNELEDRICYPRIIGDTLDTDLFQKNRLLDTWGTEERLSNVVNSAGNELFPYILDDGLTLYFSSNGHGGLGGYDIFVTRYNPQTNKYLTPTNLGMPFNSTGDDFLYAADEFANVAWFASNRNNTDGEITIYSFTPNAIKKTTTLEGDALREAALLHINEGGLGDTNELDSSILPTQYYTFEEENRPIYFVVNDTLIYKSTLQFISASALHSFKLGEENMLVLEEQKKEIAQKREHFSLIKGQTEKAAASQEIMKLENAIYELESSIESPFQQARNKEMEVLKKNQLVLFSVEDYQLNLTAEQDIDSPYFFLPTIKNNYELIFSQEEASHFLRLEQSLEKESKAISTLTLAPNTLKDIENSTTTFWRSMREVDTAFQFADSLHITNELLEQNLQANYTSLLNNLFEKVDILENKAQLLYLFVRGEAFKEEMQKLLQNAEKIKDASIQQLVNTDGVNLEQEAFNSIKTATLNCQELYEFSLVYYIEDYGGSLSLIPDSLLNDSIYIDSLTNSINDSIINTTSNKEVPQESNPLIYKVQLGVFSKELSKELLDKLPEVTILPIEESKLKKYFAGNYQTSQDANKDIKSFEEYGFKGAFVVPFIDGKLASWDEEKTYKLEQ